MNLKSYINHHLLSVKSIHHLLKKGRHNRLLALGGIYLVLSPMIFNTFLVKPKEAAAWFDDNWMYRKKIVISNSAGVQTNYPYGFSLGTLNSSQIKSDCSDIRVTNVNSIIISDPIWVDCTVSSSPTVWIKFASLSAGSTVLYIYYGNSSANNIMSDPSSIFTWAHSFNGISIDTAKITQGGGLISQNNYLSMVNNADAWDTYAYATTSQSRAADLTFQAKFKADSNARGMIGWHDNGSGASYTDLVHAIYFNQGTFDAFEDGNDRTGSGSYTVGTWYDVKVVLKATGASFYYKAVSNNTWTSIYDSSYSSETPLKPGAVQFDANEFVYTDSWIVRQQLSNEPTVSVDSEEKTAGPIAYWKFDEGYNSTEAIPLSANEQQINIFDQVFSFYGVDTNYKPTDNSLGLIHWDGSKYSDATVYFEADMQGSGSVEYITATLYTSSGTALNSSSISQIGNSFARKRSVALSLTDGTDYTVRVKGNRINTGDFYVIKAARLIIVQSASSITKTETQIEIGSSESLSANTATELTNKKIYQYDSSKFTPAPTAYFEGSLKSSPPTIEQQINIIDQTYSTTSNSYVPTDNSLGLIRWPGTRYSDATVYFEAVLAGSGSAETAYASLYAGDTAVNGSEISKQSAGYALVRSSAISLTNGTDYSVRLKGNRSGDTYTLRAARIIVQQTNPAKITNTQTSIEIGDNTTTSSTSYTALTNPKYYQYNKDLFSPTVESSGDATFSASLKVADGADTAYAALYNKTHGTMVAEVSTSNTTWTYRDVSDIDSDADWDTTNDDDYEVQIRCVDGNGGGCTTSLANAKIVLDQYSNSGITAFETLQQQMNTSQSVTGTSPTSQNYRNLYNYGLSTVQNSFAGGTFTYYYESTLKTSTATTTTAYAGLYNVTNASTITNSLVSSTAITYSRQRSADITANLPQFPQPSVKTMDTTLYNSTAGQTTTASTSWLIIKVSGLATSTVTAYADLYNLTDSAQVSNSEISTSSASWGLPRSGSISLHSGDSYSVRLRSSNNGANVYLANAKIILDQVSSDGITAVETMYQMINSPMTDADNGYSNQYLYNSFDPSNFTYQRHVTPSDIFFESTIKTSAGTGYAILNSGSDITSSEVSNTLSTYSRKRSGSLGLVMPTTTTNMDTRLKNGASNITSATNSWIVVQNNDTIANVIHDASGNFHHGNANNSPTWKDSSDCKFDKCLSFDGTNDFVAAGDSYDFDIAASDSFTISAWFKHPPSSSGQDTILAKYYSSTGTDGGYKLLMEADGDITFAIDDDSTWSPDYSVTSTSGSYDDNNWHQIEAVKNGSTNLTLYIDGVLVGTSSSISGTGTLANTDSLYIGIDGDGASNPWAGMLDEIKIYPYARSSNQIKVDFMGAGQVLGAGTRYVLANGLVGYWKMDETSTPSADFSGNGNDGTWYNGVASASGKFGGSASFDGTDDYIGLGTTVANIDSGDFTFTAWVKLDSKGSDRDIITVGDLGTATELRYDVGEDNFQFDRNDSAGFKYAKFSQESPSLNSWYHIAGVRKDNTLKIYVNGIEGITTGTLISDHSNWGRGWAIGRLGDDGRYFDGLIDEVRVYKRALSPVEVTQLYNWAPGPVGWWKMDEGSGTAYDSSGNGNNLTNNNSTTYVTGKFGNAASFTRTSSQSLTLTDASQNGALDVSENLTISAWIKPYDYASPSYRIVNKTSTWASNYAYDLGYNSSGGVFFGVSSNGTTRFEAKTANATLNTSDLNRWYHIEAVANVNQDLRIYINGVLASNGTDNPLTYTNGSIFNSSSDFRIGSSGENEYMNGSIDDVRVYNYARTSAQIVEDMNAGHPAPGSPVGSAVAEWNFDEGYGDTAHNMGNGSGLDASLAGTDSCPGDSNCPAWTNSGKYGKALLFDGTDDYVATSQVVTTQYDNFTASMWVNWDGNSSYQTLIRDGISGTGWMVRTNDSIGDKLEMVMESASTGSTDYVFTPGVWTHVVAIRDNRVCRFYINGQEIPTTSSCYYNPPTPTTYTIIGANSTTGQNSFKGKIDDVRIYNSVLTPDQVKLLYNQGQSAVMGAVSTASSSATMTSSARSYCPPGDTGTCNPPIAEWKFDENSGGISNDTTEYNNYAGHLPVDGSLGTWAPGKSGYAGVFNGSEYYLIDTARMTGLTSLNAWTISAWIYPTLLPPSTVKTVFFSYKAGGSSNYYLQTNGTELEGGFYASGDFRSVITSGLNLQTNRWYHVTFAFDTLSHDAILYVDGIQQVKTNLNYTPEQSMEGAEIGRNSSWAEYWSGKIDQLTIYNYVRTPAQIAWDYNQGAPVAWYKFDECSGTTLHDIAPKTDDNSTKYNLNLNIGATYGYTTAGTCNSGVSTESWNDGTNGKYSSSLAINPAGETPDDYAVANNDVDVQDWTALSVSAWIKPGTNHNGKIVSKSDSTDGGWGSSSFFLSLDDYDIDFNVGTANCDYSAIFAQGHSTSVTSSQWSHVVGTWDGHTAFVYINGQLSGKSTTYTDPSCYMNDYPSLTLGTDAINPNQYFRGQIDDVKIFNYALTPEQVKIEYNAGSAVSFR